MFPHTLDGDSYPLDAFLRVSRTTLECYNDGRLVNHGSITLKLKHYTNNSFQDHQFFVVETPTCKEIIVGHPASVRLGLIKVMCKNIAKSTTATEAKPNILTQITDIDGRVPCRWPRSRSKHNSDSSGWKGCKLDSFQDPISRPSYQNGQRECKTSSFQDPISKPLHMYNGETLVISDHESSEQTQLLEQLTEALQEYIAVEFETPFKTLHIKRIWVSGDKNIEETHFKTPTDGTWGSREQQRQKLTPFKTPVQILDRDLVRNRSRQTSFKTMAKSGKKNTSSQDMVGKVSENLIPFKTPNIKYRTSRVHFKTFDNWAKARKMKYDTILKDVSSFISEEKGEDQLRSYPSHRQPNSQWTKNNGDPQTSRSSPIDRGGISMGDYHSRRESTMEHRGEFTMEPNRASPKLQRWETASNSQRGKDSKQNCHGSSPFQECSNVKEAKKLKSDRNDSFQDPRPKQKRRVTIRDTKCALLHLNHSFFITSSSALDTGLTASIQKTSSLASHKKEIGQQKVI